MDPVSSALVLDKTNLGTLAMRFRGTRDEVIRREIARAYAEIVDRLIASGTWTEFPGFENMLPDDWMSEAFFDYWGEGQQRSKVFAPRRGAVDSAHHIAGVTVVKIGCHCGATIFDQTDDLPHKAHLIPDQEWFATFDALDDQVIDPLIRGELTKEAAYRLVRMILSQSSRLMWQCRVCGRLYIDDQCFANAAGKLHCYFPAEENTAKEILRSRDAQT